LAEQFVKAGDVLSKIGAWEVTGAGWDDTMQALNAAQRPVILAFLRHFSAAVAADRHDQQAISMRVHEMHLPSKRRRRPQRVKSPDSHFVKQVAGKPSTMDCLERVVRAYDGRTKTLQPHPTGEVTTITMYHADAFHAILDAVSDSEAPATSLINAFSHSAEAQFEGGKAAKQKDFHLSADQRYVIKFLKPEEGESFRSSSQKYVNHVLKRLSNNEDCLFAKIFGFFKIERGREGTQYVIVQENLFNMDRRTFHCFDLKGVSPGARKSQLSTGFEQELLKFGAGGRLLVSPESKERFEAALARDLELLEAMNVVDYSLLVGVSQEDTRLVVGIIDYCREFSKGLWAYSAISATNLAGGAPAYKKRFQEYMTSKFVRGVR